MTKKILTSVMIACFQLCLPKIQAAENKTVSFDEALRQGLISATAKGLGGHTGLCVEFEITGLSKKDILVAINAGMHIFPDDSGTQNMIITQEKIVALQPKAVRKMKVYAMCTQQRNYSPSSETVFAFGPMAEGNLLEVVKFLNQKKYQSQAAQHAIWALTDNSDLSGIFDEANPAVAKELLLLVAQLTGKATPWYHTEYKIQPGITETFKPFKIHAEFKYKLTEEGVVTFAVYNEAGEVVQNILENHVEKPGTHIIKIKFEAYDLPDGKYFVRFTNYGKMIEEKMFEL